LPNIRNNKFAIIINMKLKGSINCGLIFIAIKIESPRHMVKLSPNAAKNSALPGPIFDN
jgi:hypothetical protein